MSILVWPLILFVLVGMYPYSRWLLHSAEGRTMLPDHNPLLLALTTLALSTGTLSLITLIIGVIGIKIDWRLILFLYVIIVGLGFLLRDPVYVFKEGPRIPTPPRPLYNVARVAWAVTAVITLLMLFNAVYWPFSVDDAVTIYAGQGKLIASSGKLLPGTLYELYPMLVQFNYAFIFQASGWLNEYLARLIPALLAVGTIGVAYQLGRELYNHAAGLIAALLIALAPMVTHWASTGYVDLPCGFFYGLSMVFLVRLDRTYKWQDALLAGLMAGLAAWTKNSGLLIVGGIGLWVFYRLWLYLTMRRLETPIKWTHVVIIAAGFVATAGLWYTRNLIVGGTLIPSTGWTWKAERTIGHLIPFITDNRYGLSGLLFTAGLFYIGWRFIQAKGHDRQSAFVLIFTVPFMAIWWALFSYDSRFLLVLIAPIAVMAAAFMQEVWRRLPALPRMTYIPYISVFILLFALPAVSAAVDFKFDILRHPFMSDVEKHELTLGKNRYRMSVFMSSLPAGSQVMVQDQLIGFHADNMQVTVTLFPKSWDELQPYDYWVISGKDQVPDWFVNAAPIHVEENYRLFKVK